jgi:hypothetical protein
MFCFSFSDLPPEVAIAETSSARRNLVMPTASLVERLGLMRPGNL